MKDTDIGFIPTQIILLVAQVVFAGIYIGMALKGTPEVEKNNHSYACRVFLLRLYYLKYILRAIF